MHATRIAAFGKYFSSSDAFGSPAKILVYRNRDLVREYAQWETPQ